MLEREFHHIFFFQILKILIYVKHLMFIQSTVFYFILYFVMNPVYSL